MRGVSAVGGDADLGAGSSADVDVVVVGAGIAGLLAAQALGQRSLSVAVLEGGRWVGGRLATRSVGPGRADAGAQFFTTRRPEFADMVREWREVGLVFTWARGWSDGSLAVPRPEGHARYAVRGGMAALANFLATGLDVRLGRHVTAASPFPWGWRVISPGAAPLSARALLLTAPVPQSLLLLDVGGTGLAQADRDALGRIEYAPGLCGLFLLDGDAALPDPGALQRPEAPIAWLADNRRKGVSPGVCVVTVQASAEWSRTAWDGRDSEVLAHLRGGLLPYVAHGTSIAQARLERWRYSLPTVVHPHPYLVARGVPPLAFAGDAFGGPRVEGAALSGLAAADVLASRLPPPRGSERPDPTAAPGHRN